MANQKLNLVSISFSLALDPDCYPSQGQHYPLLTRSLKKIPHTGDKASLDRCG